MCDLKKKKKCKIYLCLGLEICPFQAYITRDSFSYCRMHIHYVNKQYSFTGIPYKNCKIGQCHPLATTISANMRDIIRIPIRLKIATGTYILQANRASFNRSQLNPICLLCGNGEETLDHFLLICERLDGIRAPLVKDIINTCSALFAKNKVDGNVNLIQVLVNPYFYSNNGEFTNIF